MARSDSIAHKTLHLPMRTVGESSERIESSLESPRELSKLPPAELPILSSRPTRASRVSLGGLGEYDTQIFGESIESSRQEFREFQELSAGFCQRYSF